jgi:cytochrome c556
MRITLLATALVAATLAGTAPIGTAFAEGDVIAQRRAGMKRMGEHMQAMRAVTQGQGEVRAQVARIDDMIAWYRTEPALFPPGSDRGDTRALPAIWTNRADFDRQHVEIAERLQALRGAAQAGDAAAFANAFQQVGASCSGCHRPYRAPER